MQIYLMCTYYLSFEAAFITNKFRYVKKLITAARESGTSFDAPHRHTCHLVSKKSTAKVEQPEILFFCLCSRNTVLLVNFLKIL